MGYDIDEQQFRKIFEQYKQNRTEVAKHFGVSRTSINTWARKYGYPKGKAGRIYPQKEGTSGYTAHNRN